jgi:dienelactone hydrolase
MPDLTHLDDLTGVLARALQVLRPTPRNTLDRLGVYEGLEPDVLFPAPSRVPAVERRARWRLGGLASEDLTFPSLHDPLEPAFRRYYHARQRRIHTVYVRSIRPDAAAHRPRLLYIHGYMQPETLIEEFALLSTLSRVLQMEVVQIQPPYHGRRKPRSSRFDGELYWTADLVRSIESIRQTILDARTLLAWMRKESSQPVGIVGLSLGGALAAALTCLEPGFAFSAPVIGHMDLAALVTDAPVLGAMRADLARFGWKPLRRLHEADGLERAAAGDPERSHPSLRRQGRSLLPRVGHASDVAPLGEAEDPLVPDEPHGLPAVHPRCGHPAPPLRGRPRARGRAAAQWLSRHASQSGVSAGRSARSPITSPARTAPRSSAPLAASAARRPENITFAMPWPAGVLAPQRKRPSTSVA